jgi:subtilisin family serine protease
MPNTSFRVLAASLFALWAGAPSHAQGAKDLAEGRIEPQLLRDAERLAADGFLREGDRVRPDLRVVIELEQQPGDVTFETSTAADPVADVQAAVIQRQAQFLDGLDAAMAPAQRAAVRILFPLELQYMLAAEVQDGGALRALAAAPGVRFVWKDNLNQLHTVQGRQITGSSQQASFGWTGAGVGVAVLDGNFDLLHPELGGSTTLPNPIVKGGYNYSTPGGPIHSQTWGNCYHGTGVASIVRRYAPGCHLYTLVVFPNSFDSVIANAINWCVTNKNGVGGGAPIKVINMSLGGGQHTGPVSSGTLHNACTTALSNDILCFASAGNEGWTNAMGSPAASTSCISVGSTWDSNGAPYTPFAPTNCTDPTRLVDERACYSNTASFLSIYCPSEEVICAQCGGGTFDLGGTSSASPAAAGLTAQLLHARGNLAGDLSAVVGLYQSTGVSVIGDASKRRVNLSAAIAAAPPHQLRFTAFTTSGVFQQPGATITLSPTVINEGPQSVGLFDVEFFLASSTTWSPQDIYLGKVQTGLLLAGQSTVAQLQVQLPWRLPLGVNFVHAVADRLNDIVEWNENDNSISSPVFGQAGPCVVKLEYNDPLITPHANAAVSVTTGGTVHPTVVVPCVDPMTTLYLIAWGASGTAPGVQLSPSAFLPLNPDSFTDLGLAALNGAVLQNFLGIFTPQGIGQATFALPPSTGLVSVQTHLAAILISDVELFAAASNALALQLTP